jgi:protein phosphatase
VNLFERIFRRRPAALAGNIEGAEPPLAEIPAFVVDSDLLSDVGCVRTNNEDCGRIFRSPAKDGDDGPGRQLIVVADGMGGYNAGEVASAIVVDTLAECYENMRQHPARELKRAVEAANQRIYKQSEKNSDNAGMGTTCTALLLQDGRAYSAHVGDSRLYLLRGGGIYLMIEEHSQVMEMVRAGLLQLSEARHHPDKNVITRALGRQETVEVSTWPAPLAVRVGDGFLLCSDGLCDQIEDEELLAVVEPRSAASACEELVRIAKQRGGTDNITVAVVRLLPVGKPSQMKETREVEVPQ